MDEKETKTRTVLRKINGKLVLVPLEKEYEEDERGFLTSLSSIFGRKESKGNVRSKRSYGSPIPREVPKLPKKHFFRKIMPKLSFKRIKRNRRKT